MNELKEAEFSVAFAMYRYLHSEEVKHWVERFKNLCGCNAHTSVLDIGCGTGRFAYILARYLGCMVYGLDFNGSMLTHAAKRTSQSNWIRGNAESLPFKSCSFEVAYLSMLLEHIVNREKALFEACRVLKTGGRIAIRMCDQSQLAQTSWYRYFPTALKIDMTKMPSLEELRQILQSVGFKNIFVYKFNDERVERSTEYIARIENKAYTALRLIPFNEFISGASQLKKELALTQYFRYNSPCTLIVCHKL